MLQTYFGQQPQSPLTSRLLFEYPYHLAITGDSDKMREFLSSLQVFASLYTERDKYDFLHYWSSVGPEKDRAGELYRAALHGQCNPFYLRVDAVNCVSAAYKRSAPSKEGLLKLQNQVAQFLKEMGDPNGAIPLLKGEDHVLTS